MRFVLAILILSSSPLWARQGSVGKPTTGNSASVWGEDSITNDAKTLKGRAAVMDLIDTLTKESAENCRRLRKAGGKCVIEGETEQASEAGGAEATH